MQTPSASALPCDSQALVAAYEELRGRFLNRQQGLGLTLFMRRGMSAWMNAFPPGLAASPTSVPAAPDGETVLPAGMRAEVVLILAGMLLHGCQEARP
jgi:hypothetical protein